MWVVEFFICLMNWIFEVLFKIVWLLYGIGYISFLDFKIELMWGVGG